MPKNSRAAAKTTKINIKILYFDSRYICNSELSGNSRGTYTVSPIIKSDIYETTMITTGVDYTLPVSNGILILLESMYVSTIGDATKDFQNYTAFMASMPLGILHQIMFIAHMDWKQKHNYNYLRWSSTYDRYSVNCMLSLNPKMEDYDMPLKDSSQTIINFGAGLQIMFIYNY